MSVLAHAEYGETKSRTDGWYDLAVNGGGDYRLVFELPGYLTVQRTLLVKWEEYGVAADVAMTALDNEVTAVDLLDDGQVQVARGSLVNDASGTRQATLLFPTSVEANMTLAGGNVVPLTQLSVRATEFTVGPGGSDAMPAPLPAATAYTYAVELSVDEAIAAGATRVDFSQPIPFYLDNFLGFPVGSAVPAGYYDRRLGLWIASQNGRVVAFVGVNNGIAELDTNGDQVADDTASLAALGITDQERGRIAEIYTAGQTLWRVPIDHFTPWDYNWPYSLPPNTSYPPNQRSIDDYRSPLTHDGADDKSPDDDCTGNGSILRFEEGSVGESVDIAGTPFKLSYTSARGRRTTRTGTSIQIKVLPDEPILSPSEVVVSTKIGGKETKQVVPSGQQYASIMWDGRNAYGQVTPGAQTVTVKTCYKYPLVYNPVRADFERSFNSVRGLEAVGPYASVVRSGTDAQLCSSFQETVASSLVGALEESAWSLDVHHVLDPVSRTVYRGDGGTQSAAGQVLGAAINDRFGGQYSPVGLRSGGSSGFMGLPDGSILIMYGQPGSSFYFDVLPNRLLPNGQRVPATTNASYWNKRWYELPRIIPGPNGTVYITEYVRPTSGPTISEIKRYTLDANYNLVQPGTLLTTLETPWSDIAAGPDGSLYVVRSLDILKVSPDGTSRVFHTFSPISGAQKFRFPIAVSMTTGIVYVVEQYRVSSSSAPWVETISAFPPAGGRSVILTSQAYRAGNPDLDPFDHTSLTALAVDSKSDAIFFAAGTHGRISKIENGAVVTVAGVEFTGQPDSTANTLYQVDAMGVLGDGNLYFAEAGQLGYGEKLRLLEPPVPTKRLESQNVVVPAGDGSVLYRFTAQGKHLDTLNATTGETQYVFGYDSEGKLRTVTDRFSNVTTLNYQSGHISSIVAPFGQQTNLTHDADGRISAVELPDGTQNQFTYEPNSWLLASKTDARGGVHRFAYDRAGRVSSDQDPVLNNQSISSNVSEGQITTTVTSPEARVAKYEQQNIPAGQVRTVTSADGTKEVSTKTFDGAERTVYSDGSTKSTTLAADPRWGMYAPYIASNVVRMPSGLTSTTKTLRVATFSNAATPMDPGALQTLTETRTINGRTSTSTYAAATRTLQLTTAAGRTSTAVRDSDGRTIAVTAPGRALARLQLDEHGRRASMMLDDGSSQRLVNFTHDVDSGYLASHSGPVTGQATAFTRDAVGRPISIVDPNNFVVMQSYDAQGNTTNVVPPDRPVHSLSYTSVNLLDQYSAPASSVGGVNDITDLDYNGDWQLKHVLLPDSRTLDIGYRSDGKVDHVTTPDGTTTFAYNATTGKLTGMTDPEGDTLVHVFDGKLLTASTWGGGVGHVQGTIAYTYDSSFRRATMLINGLTYANVGYDNDDLVTSIGTMTVTRSAATGDVAATAVGSATTSESTNAFGEPSDSPRGMPE
ncbi:MAG TPA: hypothetical protein VFN67_24990 [Polyangiales bacterium]|nr:hypothetical protein [Polyangiales bacterium]